MVKNDYAKSLGERLETLSGHVNGKRKLAIQSGLRESQLFRYINGDNVPSVGVVVNLSNAGDVNFEWLAAGIGRMEKSDTTDSGIIFDALVDVIEAVDDTIANKNANVSARKRADIINLAYEQAYKKDDIDTIKTMVNNMVELVS